MTEANSEKSHFICPVCLDTIKEAFMTKCGHSFCYGCLNDHFKYQMNCPSCREPLKRDQIYPNFSLNMAITNFKSHSSGSTLSSSSTNKTLQRLCDSILMEDVSLDRKELDNVVDVLLMRKHEIEMKENILEYEMMLDFLTRLRKQRQEILNKMYMEISTIDVDVENIKAKMNQIQSYSSLIQTSFDEESGAMITRDTEKEEAIIVDPAEVPVIPNEAVALPLNTRKRSIPEIDSMVLEEPLTNLEDNSDHHLPNRKLQKLSSSLPLSTRRKRYIQHFEELKDCYFETRLSEKKNSFQNFSKQLFACSKRLDAKCIATLKYSDTSSPPSSIVSSVEFDSDESILAIAGVSKRIKLFDFQQIVNITSEIHCPVKEISGSSKISCLSWNNYIKSHLVSSDYEGLVTLWDACMAKSVCVFDEHKKRTWSVDFSKTDPTRIISGSDDAKAKLWSTNSRKSSATIDCKANICSVKFNPEYSHFIAIGAADHHVHYYDLRKMKQPLTVYKHHKKAVSYVQFLNKDEMISASTDSTLKFWDLRNSLAENPLKTYSGHINEKNFVGLATTDFPSYGTDLIACGSETNSVHIYMKAISKPILTHKFKIPTTTVTSTTNIELSSNLLNHFTLPNTTESSGFPNRGMNSILSVDDTLDEESSDFVSSVCWSRKHSSLVAANSKGIIKVFRLSAN